MSELAAGSWLARPVDGAHDHVLGPANAAIMLVEYGSCDRPHCRAANANASPRFATGLATV